MNREVSFPCPVCGEGDWTITVDSDGNEIGSAEINCSASAACENCYANGQYGDQVAAAIAAAVYSGPPALADPSPRLAASHPNPVAAQ